MEDYFVQLNAIGDSLAPLSTKIKMAQRAEQRLFLADQTSLWDDLYRENTIDEYFRPRAYMMTVISWYPQGIFFSSSGIELGAIAYNPKRSALTCEVRFTKHAHGTNFYGHRVAFTDTLEMHVAMELKLRSGEIAVRKPRILAIIPFPRASFTENGEVIVHSSTVDPEDKKIEIETPVEKHLMINEAKDPNRIALMEKARSALFEKGKPRKSRKTRWKSWLN
ncbi:MAG: hypothetical protein AAF998_02295 [Bacteroidota bacterium]